MDGVTEAYRRLALGVIFRAGHDIHSPGNTTDDILAQASAALFFVGPGESSTYGIMAEVLGVDTGDGRPLPTPMQMLGAVRESGFVDLLRARPSPRKM